MLCDLHPMLVLANHTNQAAATKELALKGSNSAYEDSKKLPDDGEIAGSLCFGEATIQLQLTRGIVRDFTIDNMAVNWKVLLLAYSSSQAAIFHPRSAMVHGKLNKWQDAHYSCTYRGQIDNFPERAHLIPVLRTLVQQMTLSLNNLNKASWDTCFLPCVEVSSIASCCTVP